MSEGKPTPGPWEVCGKYIEPPNRAEWWICELPGKPDVEAKANGRLIAASPELYEVASMVVQIKQLSEELGAMSEEEQEERGHIVYAKRSGLNAELWGKAEAAVSRVEGC